MVEVEPYQALEAFQMVEIQEVVLKDSSPQEVGLVRVLTVFYKIIKMVSVDSMIFRIS